MKKITAILLCLALLMLAGCGGSPSGAAPASEHNHTAENWSADYQNHWRSCPDCGTEYDKAAHTIENDKCTVCQTHVLKYEDGTVQITCYNEQGDEIVYASYAADGQEQYRDRLEYSYDADGKMLSSKYYSGDVLSIETEYGVTADGEIYAVKDIYYNDDGTSSVNEYDEHQNTVYSANYAADGSVEYAGSWELSADGSTMHEKQYEGERLTSESEYRIDEEGGQRLVKSTYYNEDGSSETTEYDGQDNELAYIVLNAEGKVETERRYEHSYNEEGQVILTKTYENGRLTQEMEFIVGSDDEGSWSMSGKTTEYNEDGSKSVSDSDPDGAWSSVITYDSQGNVTEELRYEYEYNDKGDQTVGRSYKNGKLTETMEVVADANGETEFIIRTQYLEDGGKQVRKYDTNFDVVEETAYDANGNVKAN